jgi:uracil-DNA glycosylase family 4
VTAFDPQRGVKLLLAGWQEAGLAALPAALIDPALLADWTTAAPVPSAAASPATPAPPPRPSFQPRGGGFGSASTPSAASPSAAPTNPLTTNVETPVSPQTVESRPQSPLPKTPVGSPPPQAAEKPLFELEAAPVPRPAATKSSAKTGPVTPEAGGLPGQPARGAPALEATRRSLAERTQLLTVLSDRVKTCRRCDELASARTNTVFGVGNMQPRLVFVGEAPGADEDASGIPFVGKAGQLLDKIIVASGLKREELYICNILKCRPPDNRTPEPQECANCREYLEDQLAILDPEFIVCWGAVAATNVTGKQVAIGKLRRQFFQFNRAKVLCTYHPSYLLRNPAAKKDVWEDMKLLLGEMGLPIPAG